MSEWIEIYIEQLDEMKEYVSLFMSEWIEIESSSGSSENSNRLTLYE